MEHAPAQPATEHDVLLTLFDLGRQVTSVLELSELLPKIPELVARLIPFDAFGVYLYQERREELKLEYAVGYPDREAGFRIKAGEGIVGRAIKLGEPIVVGDAANDPYYIEVVPGMVSDLVVPMMYKSRAIGALNVLSHSPDQYGERDVQILRQFGTHVAVALENARLFEQARQDAAAFETLSEIGSEVAALLDLDELLPRIAQLAKRFVEYRTFGILLQNEATRMLEMRVAVQYGEKVAVPHVKLGEGLVGYAALHREAVYVPDVSKDPRYIKIVDDVRSELAVPLLLKDRCIGVFDLESPELDAFSKRDVEILTLLASQAAVAIENARLYAEVSETEARLEKELRFAQRVQAALLPTELPKRIKGVDVAAAFSAARELGGDFHDFLSPESNTLVVALGDVSGKGVPAALYSVFAGELVRGRTFRRRYVPERSTPAGILTSMNTILHQRQLEEYYCTLIYAVFDFKRRSLTLANSGVPYPIHCTSDRCYQIEQAGVPLGSFFGTTYDEITVPIGTNDVFVLCSDGVFEAMNERGEEFTAARLMEVVSASKDQTARDIVQSVVAAVEQWRDGYPPNDDMTVVALKITLPDRP
ncbi:MAG: GAF domain-containing protein [Acidobacteriota bacterium]|nr:GAF domain-containing protein [Acidobacteriota bacterium]